MTDDIDLTAWEAPEPPDDLADSVIARVGGTAITPAIPVEEPIVRRRALLIGGVAAGVLAVTLGVWALIRSTERATAPHAVQTPRKAEVLVGGGPPVTVAQAPSCDANELKRQGLRHMAKENYAAALAELEASLRCKQENDVLLLAAQAACKAHDEAKVNEYTAKLPVGLRAAAQCISCDANALKEQGLKARDPAKALAWFEKSLACKQDATVVGLAYEMACSAKDLAKAKHYYDALTPKPKTMCSMTTTCDANDLKDEGMRAMSMGEHAKALTLFEQSLACNKESEVVAFAFMSACNAANKSKARTFYGELSKAQQLRYEVMCTRNGIDVSSTCDADDLKGKGMEAVDKGEHAKALTLFEQSLACKSDSYVTALAFMAACNAGNATKAQALYSQLTPKQRAYKIMCERNGVELEGACDADKLKDDGMNAVNNADHAKALSLFEQSLACKADAYVTTLAFMAACSAKDAPKARRHYRDMTPAQQKKFQAICIRNSVDLDDDWGSLHITSKPAAKILVDGKDTGKTTPMTANLVPGKHKVTFVIGNDHYTYAVTIVAGQTETLTKDLQ